MGGTHDPGVGIGQQVDTDDLEIREYVGRDLTKGWVDELEVDAVDAAGERGCSLATAVIWRCEPLWSVPVGVVETTPVIRDGVVYATTDTGRFAQISGFKFTYDAARPAGSRVVSVTLDDGTNLPGALHCEFLDIFADNGLVKPGAVTLLHGHLSAGFASPAVSLR